MMIWMGNVGGTFKDSDWSLDDQVTGLRVAIRNVKFKQPMPKQPAVILGFTSLDAGADKNLRARVEATDVTTTGFNAKFTTWSDSVTYGLSASWIAIAA
jgi:hypothetical protein